MSQLQGVLEPAILEVEQVERAHQVILITLVEQAAIPLLLVEEGAVA
jgi:hypothetical protein